MASNATHRNRRRALKALHLFGLFLQVVYFPHHVVVVFSVSSCMNTLGIEPRSQPWKP